MTELQLNGYSDDILQLEGDIDKSIYPPQDYKLLLSDGTLLHIYMDWEWKIDIISTGPDTTYEKYSAGSEKAESITGRDHSDVVKLFNEQGFQKAFVIDEVHEVVENEK